MGATGFRVRLAAASDAETLARLRYELRSTFHNVIESEGEFIARCSSWMLPRLRAGGAWKCWLAEIGSTPIGNVWLQLIEKLPNPVDEPEAYAYLTNFFVREEYRGQGIGTMLLAEALAWSRSNDASAIILWPTERSKPLYVRHGFKPADDFMELVL